MKTIKCECVVALECGGKEHQERTWKQIDDDIKSQVECYDDVQEEDYAMLDLCPHCGSVFDVPENRKTLNKKLEVFS